MKQILSLLLALGTTGFLAAQAPQGINYQAALRNGSGQALAITPVTLRLGIYSGAGATLKVYEETHSLTSNSAGVVNCVIGKGSATSGNFSTINWGGDQFHLKAEANTGGGFLDLGTQQLISVPYAMYSNQAGSISGTLSPSQIGSAGATTDQVLSWNGSNWVPKNAATGTITGVTAGTGLTGGGSSGTLTLSALNTDALWNANQLQGKAVQNTTPANNNILRYNGTQWTPSTETVTTAGTGLSINSGTINSVWTQSGSSIFNNNSGFVGIGTNTPNYNLHALASSGSTNIAAEVSSANNSASLIAKGNNGVNDFLMLSKYGSSYSGTASGINQAGLAQISSGSSGTGLLLQVQSSSPMYFATSSVERMRITANGNLGFNTTAPNTAFRAHIIGPGTINNSFVPYYQAVLMAEDTSSANFSSSGIVGRGGWRGVMGYNRGNTGGTSAIGVYGLVEGSNYLLGYGVRGEATGAGPNSIGVSGLSTAGTKSSIGVYGVTNNSTTTAYRVGVYGSGNNTGVYGTSSGTGWNITTLVSNLTMGVAGQVRSVASGRPVGVVAIAGTTGINGQTGLMALADSNTNNYGVEGYGMYGKGNNFAVYGYATGGTVDYAGYFAGLLYANSSSSGVKAFKIDHPQDPENKYLYHSSVESPDMMNIYNGNVITDAEGKAVVQLPSYFSALNRDFRYQLTCMGQFAQAMIEQEIEGNEFIIRTDKPDVKVSWMVTGIRKDATAEHNRIQVEVDKPESEKGFYLDPQAYGLGMERNAAWHYSGLNRNLEYKGSDRKPEVNPVALPVSPTPK